MQRIRSAATKARALPGKTVETVRLTVAYTAVAVLSFSLLITISVFMYGTFYFAFVPAPAHEGEVFPVFEPCDGQMGKCGFLNGTVHFTKVGKASLAIMPLNNIIS